MKFVFILALDMACSVTYHCWWHCWYLTRPSFIQITHSLKKKSGACEWRRVLEVAILWEHLSFFCIKVFLAGVCQDNLRGVAGLASPMKKPNVMLRKVLSGSSERSAARDLSHVWPRLSLSVFLEKLDNIFHHLEEISNVDSAFLLLFLPLAVR